MIIHEQKQNAMETFKKALDFIKQQENNPTALTCLIERLLVEASDKQIATALQETEYFLMNLNKQNETI
jgi:hypothetical protein